MFFILEVGLGYVFRVISYLLLVLSPARPVCLCNYYHYLNKNLHNIYITNAQHFNLHFYFFQFVICVSGMWGIGMGY